MKRKRFSVEQIIRILKEGEALGNVREACRQHIIIRSKPIIGCAANLATWKYQMQSV
ncbi:MAG: hypothetical protein ACI8ZB_003902 [Desulforhopalus sp.]|jgi:hypothetical protein